MASFPGYFRAFFLTAATAVVTASAALTFTLPATAQGVIPGPAEPGRAEAEVRDIPVTRRSKPPAVIPSEAAATDFPDADVSLTLNEVIVEGSTVFDAGDFTSLYAEFIGKEVPVSAIFQIAEQATALYRRKGYILSQVIVPPQEIDGGVIRLQAIEGFVDKVIVEGEDGSWRDLVRKMTEKITRSRPLHSKVLERYLLLAGDLAGLTVNGVLAPSEDTPGAATLTVKTKLDRFDAAFLVTNDGSNFVGPFTGAAGITLNSIAGQHERIGLRAQTASSTRELFFVEGFAAVPFGTEGLTAYGRVSNSDSDPGNGLERFGVANGSLYVTGGLRYPVIRSRRMNLFVDAQFDWIDLSSDSSAFGLLSDDNLRVLRLSADFDFADVFLGARMPGVTTISARISQGLDAFGATQVNDPLASRANAGGSFTAVRAEIQRYQKLPVSRFSLLLAARGQYAGEELLASEEISFGAIDYLRGYDPSAILGDRGVAGKAELQFTQTLDENVPFIDRFQLYSFYDTGYVENLNFYGAGLNRGDVLHSTGGGVRLAFLDKFDLDLGLAYRMNDSTSATTFGSDRIRGYFRLTGEF